MLLYFFFLNKYTFGKIIKSTLAIIYRYCDVWKTKFQCELISNNEIITIYTYKWNIIYLPEKQLYLLSPTNCHLSPTPHLTRKIGHPNLYFPHVGIKYSRQMNGNFVGITCPITISYI